MEFPDEEVPSQIQRHDDADKQKAEGGPGLRHATFGVRENHSVLALTHLLSSESRVIVDFRHNLAARLRFLLCLNHDMNQGVQGFEDDFRS